MDSAYRAYPGLRPYATRPIGLVSYREGGGRRSDSRAIAALATRARCRAGRIQEEGPEQPARTPRPLTHAFSGTRIARTASAVSTTFPAAFLPAFLAALLLPLLPALLALLLAFLMSFFPALFPTLLAPFLLASLAVTTAVASAAVAISAPAAISWPVAASISSLAHAILLPICFAWSRPRSTHQASRITPAGRDL